MRQKTQGLYNRTAVQHWLTTDGKGLSGLLVNSRARRAKIPEDEMVKRMKQFTGRISENYQNDSNAHIKYRGIDVFFNPSATRGEIDKTKINHRVRFGLGFSYDGPRAYNTSITLIAPGETVEPLAPLMKDKIVRVEVTKNIGYYTQVRIIPYDEFGSIHVNDLKSPYSSNQRPLVGTVLEGRILGKKYDAKAEREVWSITLDTIPEDKPEGAMAAALKKANIKFD